MKEKRTNLKALKEIMEFQNIFILNMKNDDFLKQTIIQNIYKSAMKMTLQKQNNNFFYQGKV